MTIMLMLLWEGEELVLLPRPKIQICITTRAVKDLFWYKRP